jgi:chromosome segregation protein
VIGQGMVEGFLNTSLSERKEFFDEATGVKQYQIKRDDALGKLRSSYENLHQAQMLVNEIEPRLKSLTRQVNRLKRRGEIESELKDIQSVYYKKIWHEINDQFVDYNSRFLEVEKNKIAKDKKLEQLQKELEQIKKTSGGETESLAWQDEIAKAQMNKEELNIKLAKLEAQMEVKLEANGQYDVSFLIGRRDELEKEIASIKEEVAGLEEKIEIDRDKSAELAKEKARIDAAIKELNENLIKTGQNADRDTIRKINHSLHGISSKFREANRLETMAEIKNALAAIEADIEAVLELSARLASGDIKSETSEAECRSLRENLNKLTANKEELNGKIHDNNIRFSARSERAKILKENAENLEKEQAAITDKIKQKTEKISLEDMEKEKQAVRKEIEVIDKTIQEIKDKIMLRGRDEENKINKLFVLQQNLQDAQNEINVLTGQLNDLKVNATRFETKLEDLEIEIREELGGLKDIKQDRGPEEVLMEETKEKITQLKRQLEMIGGIDPQTEKEYEETKERFDFLHTQTDDLLKAVDSLQKIIKELDLTIKDQFDKEFKLIEKKFEEYFKILFNGGNAKIIKVMEEEMKDEEEEVPAEGETKEMVKGGEKKEETADLKRIKYLQKYNATGLAGIEIQATPPGKKIKSITMLSGGERALTAIALICAIISSNPSPFVVLDEVDAALDEANSERLAQILDELSHKTQFIVITHNRASMRKANVLYGITMTDDGVSKLLSVKLDEVNVG